MEDQRLDYQHRASLPTLQEHIVKSHGQKLNNSEDSA